MEIVLEEKKKKRSMWDFPKQQEEKKLDTFLLTKGILK